MVLDNVLIPWEDVFFYQHTRAAQYIRGTLHRYSRVPYTLRVLYMADMMIGAALGTPSRPASTSCRPCARSSPTSCATARASMRTLTAASPGAAEPRRLADAAPVDPLRRPRHACSNLPQMMHIARELCGGQICVTPNDAAFAIEGPSSGWTKFYSLNQTGRPRTGASCWRFARDLLNSDYAGHRLTFVQFAQAPHFNHLPRSTTHSISPVRSTFVRNAAGLSDRVKGSQ